MSEQVPDRVLTAPLVVFLALVLGIVATAMVLRHPRPDLNGSIEMLADGDLDRRERQRMLLRVVELAKDGGDLRQRWAGALAAISLQDRASFEAFELSLGAGPARLLPADQHEWLAMGDVVLANVHLAMTAEASGNKQLALSKWGQVGAQARVTANALAGELAKAAEQRLQ
ncbi:MAG: hypothetical protein ACI89X_001068 [Planctomycetota bacterium]|jgi:hypothetical protein